MAVFDHVFVNARVVKTKCLIIKVLLNQYVFIFKDEVNCLHILIYFQLKKLLLLLFVEHLRLLNKLWLEEIFVEVGLAFLTFTAAKHLDQGSYVQHFFGIFLLEEVEAVLLDLL